MRRGGFRSVRSRRGLRFDHVEYVEWRGLRKIRGRGRNYSRARRTYCLQGHGRLTGIRRARTINFQACGERRCRRVATRNGWRHRYRGCGHDGCGWNRQGDFRSDGGTGVSGAVVFARLIDRGWLGTVFRRELRIGSNARELNSSRRNVRNREERCRVDNGRLRFLHGGRGGILSLMRR